MADPKSDPYYNHYLAEALATAISGGSHEDRAAALHNYRQYCEAISVSYDDTNLGTRTRGDLVIAMADAIDTGSTLDQAAALRAYREGEDG